MEKENLWNFNNDNNYPPNNNKKNKNKKEQKKNSSNESSENSSEEEFIHTLKIRKETCKGIFIDKKNYEKLLKFLTNLLSINKQLRNELIKIKFEKETQTNEIQFFNDETLKKITSKFEEKIQILNNSIETLKKENESIKNSNKIEIEKIKEKYSIEIENLNKKIKFLKH